MSFTNYFVKSLLKSKKNSFSYFGCSNRCLSLSCINQKEKKTWLSKFLTVRNIEPTTDAHSKLLSDSESVYELQIHDVKPGCMQQYLKNYENFMNEIKLKEINADIFASFKVLIGDQDQVINIWRYKNGYSTANKIFKLSNSDQTIAKLNDDQANLLRKRENQFMIPFSFWGVPEPIIRNCNYEMRSYILKPGTMIEWGNNWAKGITFRQNKVGGFFSQIGQLYMVHHIWYYDDFQNRKDVREKAWRKPGWDEVVAYTVPLIREMRCRWLIGNSFSPLR